MNLKPPPQILNILYMEENQEVINKLTYFIEQKKVPHILFHGVSGSGKKSIVRWFIQQLYPNKETINDHVMFVNCGHCKGIKFVREELKFFSKTNINVNGYGGNFFKSVVLLNADKLTMDAQSAMRRCIEIFSHNTRFFIVVEDKYKILKPILSRFCEIYLRPSQTTKNNILTISPITSATIETSRYERLHQLLTEADPANQSIQQLLRLSTELYDNAYHGLDLMKYIEKEYSTSGMNLTMDTMVDLLFTFNKIKKEIRNEKIFLFIILYSTYHERNVSDLCDNLIEVST